MMGYGYGAGWGLLGILWMLIPLALLGLVIYAAVRAAVPGGTSPARRPVEIAEERYARGEITYQELEEIRRNLQKR